MNRIALIAGVAVFVLAVPLKAAPVETVLHSFCSLQGCKDGAHPYAGLIDVNGTLYGTTWQGGGGRSCEYTSCGTLFSLDPATGTETVAHFFRNDGHDGWYPDAGLFNRSGVLYGTTWYGGAYGYGSVFSFDPATGAERVVHSYQNDGVDGFAPYAGLIATRGTFYGTTAYGGTHGTGTVFSLDPNTGAEAVLYSFCSRRNCRDGNYLLAGLVALNRKLFGTTVIGGRYGDGAAYSVDIQTGAEKVLHSFQYNGADGVEPLAGLVALNGTIYGTTSQGGSGGGYGGGGVVFSINPATGAESVIYSFKNNGVDGIAPEAGLIAVGGTLYGTTASGGPDHVGTVFSFDPATGTETVLHAFRKDGSDGEVPQAALLAVNDELYGTTVYGGTHGYGTVFNIRLPRVHSGDYPRR